MATIPEYQKIVTDLRQCIKNVDALTESDVIAKFKAYETAVEKINERLIACNGFIKQGMKAHAIHQAEIEPSLIESVEALDIPEFLQWMQTGKNYGIHLPQIEMDAAKAVNQAYDTQVPLEPLLRAYRKLALQRAPLAKRLALLRKISDADPQTLIWQEDLEGFERARIEELKEEIIPLCQMINENVSQENHAELERVLKELTESQWIEQPPSKIVQKLKQAKDKSSRKLSYEQLKEVEVSLNEAYNELDIDQGRIWRDRWDQTIPRCPLDFDDPVMTRAQAALGWIHEEDERAEKALEVEGAILAIETLLDNGGEIANIDAEIARATKYDDPLPEYLDERVENYRYRHHRRRNQKLIAVITAAALLIISTAAVGIYLIKRSSEASQFENQISQIQNLIQNESWEAALTSIEGSTPAIQADPRVEECKHRAEGELTDINAQRNKNITQLEKLTARFAELSTAAKAAKEQSTATNIAPLNTVKTQVESFIDQTTAAETMLLQSKDMLETERDQRTILTQQQEMNDLNRGGKELANAIRDATRSLFSLRFDKLDGIYDSLKGKITELTPAEVDELENLASQFETLSNTFKAHVSNATIKLISPKVKEIGQTVSQLRNAARFAGRIKYLAKRMTSSNSYKRALQQLTKDWPEDPRINQIKDAISDTEIWSEVENFNQLVRQHATFRNIDSIGDFSDVETWVEEAEGFISKNPDFPHAKTMGQCITFLTPIAKRQDFDSIFEELTEYLDEDGFADMAMIRVYDAPNNKQGYKDYYAPHKKAIKPRPAGLEGMLFYYYSDNDFDDTALERFFEKVKSSQIKDRYPTPQIRLKSRITQDFEQLKTNSAKDAFENTIKRMLGEVLTDKNWDENDQQLNANAIIRHRLITNILSAAVQASHSMNQTFQGPLQTFKADDARWGDKDWVKPQTAATWESSAKQAP